ncbi:FxsA family protein [Thorsellia kenyensis]|uniref:FxsA family protein n=1 Tax=Thorsellia kenyensis TaxID=1549888 RepID=A0ABV6CE68_9GAMM
MKLIFLFCFFVLIYFEVSVFVWIANETSVLTAIILGLLTTVGGIGLVKRQGIANLKNFQSRMQNQENGAFETINVFFILLSGLLLLIPGFLTDILGLILLIPYVQKILYTKLHKKFKFQSSFYSSKTFDDDIIDGDYYKKEENKGSLPHQEDRK